MQHGACVWQLAGVVSHMTQQSLPVCVHHAALCVRSHRAHAAWAHQRCRQELLVRLQAARQQGSGVSNKRVG